MPQFHPAPGHVAKALVTAAALFVISSPLLASSAAAHEHHHHGPADDSKPIDAILWMHMAVQALVWLFLFPLAMVLGLVRHRLHVPLAVVSLALTTAGYFLGHSHGGRSFPHTAHGTLASLLVFYLGAQAALGALLKLHLGVTFQRTARPLLVVLHGVLGKSFPVVGWVQALFGIITLRSWCFGGHLGQCLAHHIMGSAFIAYATLLLIMAKAGVWWLRRRGCSQEMLDSTVIFAWGCVNSVTEHHGGPWTHKDLQHTLMGVLWVFGGLAGMWLSRGGKRNIVPAVVIALTGWAMSGHAQALMISTMIHALFGYALMAAGAARIVEVCFYLDDRATGVAPPRNPAPPPPSSSSRTAGGGDAAEARRYESETKRKMEYGHALGDGWFAVGAFQYLPVWLLFAAGVLFMSATDEELRWADAQGVDHVTWGLIDFSLAFLLFFWANVLIDLYTSYGGRYGARRQAQRRLEGDDESARNAGAAGSHGRTRSGVHDSLLRSGGSGRYGLGDEEEYDEFGDDVDSIEMARMRKERGGSARGLGGSANGFHRHHHHDPRQHRDEGARDGSGGGGSAGGSSSDTSATHVLFERADEGDSDAEEFGLPKQTGIEHDAGEEPDPFEDNVA